MSVLDVDSTVGTASTFGTVELDTAIVAEPDVDPLWAEYCATGDQGLRNRLVLRYAPLVKYVAGRIGSGLPNSVDQGDLISDGVIGLLDAIERFDPGRRLPFRSFAVLRIRGAIIDGLRSLDWVPRSVRDRVREVERAQATLLDRLARTPEDSEVAAELSMSVQELRELYSKISFTNVASFEEFGLADELSPTAFEVVEDQESRRTLMRAVEDLPERDRIIVALYYFERLSLAEIGVILKITESRVSQLHSRATIALRGALRAGV